MFFLSKTLHFPAKQRSWEKSLRRYNKRQQWNLIRWLTKTTFENLKFKKGWKTKSFINPPKSTEKPQHTEKYCDMEYLHKQDREAKQSQRKTNV